MLVQCRRFNSIVEAARAENSLYDQWFFVPGVQVSTQVKERHDGACLILRSSNGLGLDDRQVLLPGFAVCDPLQC